MTLELSTYLSSNYAFLWNSRRLSNALQDLHKALSAFNNHDVPWSFEISCKMGRTEVSSPCKFWNCMMKQGIFFPSLIPKSWRHIFVKPVFCILKKNIILGTYVKIRGYKGNKKNVIELWVPWLSSSIWEPKPRIFPVFFNDYTQLYSNISLV